MLSQLPPSKYGYYNPAKKRLLHANASFVGCPPQGLRKKKLVIFYGIIVEELIIQLLDLFR